MTRPRTRCTGSATSRAAAPPSPPSTPPSSSAPPPGPSSRDNHNSYWDNGTFNRGSQHCCIHCQHDTFRFQSFSNHEYFYVCGHYLQLYKNALMLVVMYYKNINFVHDQKLYTFGLSFSQKSLLKIITFHLQDSTTGDREPSAAARQLPLRILRPREGSDDQRHPHQHRRVLHHPQVTTYKYFQSLAIKLFESTI